MNERTIKAIELAKEVLKIARNTVLIKFRFLDVAISELEMATGEETDAIATDGELIYYNPYYVLKQYSQEKNYVSRVYLHLILHCICRHNLTKEIKDKRLWDLACDIAVECIINELDEIGLEISTVPRQKTAAATIAKKAKRMTAEMIYRCLLEQKLDEKIICELESIFRLDDHTIWYLPRSSSEEDQGQGQDQSQGQDKGQEQGQGQGQDQSQDMAFSQ